MVNQSRPSTTHRSAIGCFVGRAARFFAKGHFALSHVRYPAISRLVACCLVVIVAIGTLCACSDVGEYDATEVTKLVETYYNEKYDTRATVTDVSEETESGLFGTSSLKNYFCTMSDGSVVLYDQGDESSDDLFKDNRQSAEILAVYSTYLHEFEQTATQRFVSAGYRATVEIDDWYSLSDAELSTYIAHEDWSTNEKDFSGSYFHTKLENQGTNYVLEERDYSVIRIDSINAYISGTDAEYANAFPVDVPETPAWQGVANDVVSDVEQFCSIIAHIKIYQASDGTRKTAEAQLGDGFINGYNNAWTIYDYIDLGDGIWVTSDEYGVRLKADDLMFAEPADALTLNDFIEDGSIPKSFTSTAYKAYSLKFTGEAAARTEAELKEVGTHGGGWIELSFAFDAASMTYSDGSPYEDTVLLYSVEKNANASSEAATNGGRSASSDTSESADNTSKAQTNEPKYYLSTITYSKEPLPNGMISGKEALYFEKELLIVRM